MKVKAAKGIKCPKEGRPREYITDSKTVGVPGSPYYLRLVRDGSLIDMEAPEKIKEKAKGK